MARSPTQDEAVQVWPAIGFQDLTKAVTFYTECLGFTVAESTSPIPWSAFSGELSQKSMALSLGGFVLQVVSGCSGPQWRSCFDRHVRRNRARFLEIRRRWWVLDVVRRRRIGGDLPEDEPPTLYLPVSLGFEPPARWESLGIESKGNRFSSSWRLRDCESNSLQFFVCHQTDHGPALPELWYWGWPSKTVSEHD